jgi:Secretion system C-terminal sorting domain
MELKMIKFIMLFVVLLSAAVIAQTPNWTTVKETNINVSNALSYGSVDIFTNRDGNHIIVQESSNLKYYKMNLNGVAGSPITIESSSVVSPSISGDADNIYIVYGIGSQVRVKNSTNGGTSWSLWISFNLSTSASYMESVFSNGNLHVTYLESGVVKYRYRHSSGGSWNGPFTVSTGETGTYPRITARYTGVNNDYIFFMWQKGGTNEFKHRRYEVTSNTWGSPLPGYTVSVPNLISSNLAGFRVTGSTIIIYYSYFESGSFTYYLSWAWRDINNNNLLGVLSLPDPNDNQIVYSTTTFDNYSHTAYFFQEIAGGEGGGQSTDWAIRHSKQPSGYPEDVIYEYEEYQYNQPIYVNVSSAGNEVHVIWKDDYGNNLRYKYDDQNPVVPPNFAGSEFGSHPKITWSKIEPDIEYFEVGRQIIPANYGPKDPPPAWSYFTTTNNSYVDYSVEIGGADLGDVNYKVRSKDYSDNYSSFTSVVSFVLSGLNKQNAGGNVVNNVYEFALNQNYPNPFNPATSIEFSIKENSSVTLKVYDMLGKEVANLVNERKNPGNYSVTFNASDLPSGIYVYKLTANNFTDTKKLMLVK